MPEEINTEEQPKEYFTDFVFGRARIRAIIKEKSKYPTFKEYEEGKFEEANLESMLDIMYYETEFRRYEYWYLGQILKNMGSYLSELIYYCDTEEKRFGDWKDELDLALDLVSYFIDLDTEEEVNNFFNSYMKVRIKQAAREQKTLNVKLVRAMIRQTDRRLRG